MLKLSFGSDSPTILRPLLPVLRECRSVKVASTNHAHHELFDALSQSLSHQSLNLPEDLHDWTEEVPLLRAGHHSLSELASFALLCEPLSQVGLKNLEGECRVRGIEPCWRT